jgi:hypothetical protein
MVKAPVKVPFLLCGRLCLMDPTRGSWFHAPSLTWLCKHGSSLVLRPAEHYPLLKDPHYLFGGLYATVSGGALPQT